jgi:amidase
MKELWKLSATEVVGLLKKKKVSPLELIDAAEARIGATNPKINAFVTLCYDRARDHARRLMKKKPAGKLPPHYLYGLPIGVKDGTDVAGVRCTSGSRIYADRIAPASDIIVERLEANGAIVIGKTNLPEFAAGGNTFNDVFGATLNPWDVRTTSSGSSGGSAAALASGQVWLATGGDFGGSIRTPSSYCSTTGLRPSPGMVPRASKQPYNPLSVEGPMARNVADTALMFDCEAGWHPLDPLSQVGPHPSFSKAAACPKKPLRVAVSADLGIARAVDREVRGVCRAVAAKLARDGVAVEDAHPDLAGAEQAFLTLRGAVFVARHAELMKKHRHLYKQEIIDNTEFGLKLTSSDIVAAEIAQGELIRRTARWFENYDLLICPAVSCPPFDVKQRYPETVDGVKLEGYMGWLVLTCAITATSCPVVSLPGGFTETGLPIGLQLVGPPRSEARLLSMASYIESLLDLNPKTPIDPR